MPSMVKYWCYECDRFVDGPDHRCEQWSSTTIIPGNAVKGIEAPLRAEIERLEKEVSLAKETVVENFASAQAEIERLREALRWADEHLIPELNNSNYTHNEVCELNNNVTEVVLGLRAALAPPAPGEPCPACGGSGEIHESHGSPYTYTPSIGKE